MPVKSALEYNLLSHGKQPLWKAHRCRFVGSPDQKQVGYVVKFVGNDAAPALLADDALLGAVIVDAPTDEDSVGLTLEGSFNENQIKYADGSKLSGAGIQRLSDLGIFLDPATSNPPVTIAQPPTLPAGDGLVDSCPVEKQNDISSYALDGTRAPPNMVAIYQAFTAPKDMTVHSFKVSLRKEGAPVGNLMMWLYDTTGSYPTALPIPGSGRQSKFFDVAGVTTDPNGSLCEFLFYDATPVQLTAGQVYAIAVEISPSLSLPDPSKVFVGFSFDFEGAGGNAHYGNGGYYNGTWNADDMGDMIFYLYEKASTPPAAGPTPPAGTVALASWGVENNNAPGQWAIKLPDTGYSESFICNGNGLLHTARFWLFKRANVSTDVLLAARLYPTAMPTVGGHIAESDPINALDLAGSSSPVDFVFSGANQIQLTNGLFYSISVEQVGGTLGTDQIPVGHSLGIVGNSGDWGILNPDMGGWISQPMTTDMIFYVYATP